MEIKLSLISPFETLSTRFSWIFVGNDVMLASNGFLLKIGMNVEHSSFEEETLSLDSGLIYWKEWVVKCCFMGKWKFATTNLPNIPFISVSKIIKTFEFIRRLCSTFESRSLIYKTSDPKDEGFNKWVF